MPTLLEKQQTFVLLLSHLIEFAYREGYRLTLGEAWRTPEQAKWDSDHHIGIKNSLHILRLAIDLNLFKDNKWLTDPKEFEPLGKYWESLSTPDFKCAWGGHFNDANHFSIAYNGIE